MTAKDYNIKESNINIENENINEVLCSMPFNYEDSDDNILTCGFNIKNKSYQIFKSKCHMSYYSSCKKIGNIVTVFFFFQRNYL